VETLTWHPLTRQVVVLFGMALAESGLKKEVSRNPPISSTLTSEVIRLVRARPLGLP
jgi:hypothetical protein